MYISFTHIAILPLHSSITHSLLGVTIDHIFQQCPWHFDLYIYCAGIHFCIQSEFSEKNKDSMFFSLKTLLKLLAR